MNAGLGRRHRCEDLSGQRLLRGGDPVAPVKQGLDVGQVPVGVLLGMFDVNVGCSETTLDDGLALQADTIEPHRVDARTDQFDVDAGVDQRSQRHVAADPS